MKNALKHAGTPPCPALDCLIYAGCGAETLEKYRALEGSGDRAGQLRLLAEQRRALLERVHADEKRIEYLDYLTYRLEHTEG